MNKSTSIHHFFVFLFSMMIASNLNALVVVESVTHTTPNVCDGAIDITIVGGGGPYEFSWSDGSISEDLTRLCPGIYHLTATDIFGCEEMITVEIEGCLIQINPVITPYCADIRRHGSIHLNLTSTFEEDLRVDWTAVDGGNPAMDFSDEKAINLLPGVYCVDIYDRFIECYISQCFTVPITKDCSKVVPPSVSRPPIIMNEISNGYSYLKEYYELVVIGDGDCQMGDTYDIRGFIVDDNNGDFSIPDNSQASYPHTIYDTGFATGHIRFKYIERWRNVPIGSIILIYNSGERRFTPDPDDANGDLVYIVPIKDFGLEGKPDCPGFYCSSGYSPNIGSYFTASWATIPLFNSADSPQVRFPDGSYCHGFSYGLSDRMNGGPHNIHIETYLQSEGGKRNTFYFKGGDFLNADDYSFGPFTEKETPGRPNTDENAQFIASLCPGLLVQEVADNRDSSITDSGSTREQTEKQLSPSTNAPDVNIYPNPSTGQVNIAINVNTKLEVKINFVNLYGQKILESKHSLVTGENKITYDLTGKYHGLVLINIIDLTNNSLLNTSKLVLVNDH